MVKWRLRAGAAAATAAGTVAIACALLPARVHVARSTVIVAPQATVFELLDDPSSLRRWSPWRGPQAPSLFSGPRVGVGARMDWTGRDPGHETVSVYRPYQEVDYRMDFNGRPGWAQFTLKPARGGVRVEWRLERSAGWNPVRRVELLVFRSQAGVELERGLDRLGDVAEALPKVDLAAAQVRLTREADGWTVRANGADPGVVRTAIRLFMGLHRLTASGPARAESQGSPTSVVTPVREAGS